MAHLPVQPGLAPLADVWHADCLEAPSRGSCLADAKGKPVMQWRTRRVMRGLLAALVDERRSQTMAGPPAGEREAEGVIQSVDPVNRELVLLVEPERGDRQVHDPCARPGCESVSCGSNVGLEPVTFHVAADCLILLHRERVKMRMLQPMDRQAIQYTCGSEHLANEHLVARS